MARGNIVKFQESTRNQKIPDAFKEKQNLRIIIKKAHLDFSKATRARPGGEEEVTEKF